MTSNPCLQAVVGATWYEGEPLWPWSVADCKPFSRIQLCDEMTDSEVGLIFAQLVKYNDLDSEGNANDILYRVIESETLILPGGLQVRATANKLIYPGCCCGLEEWREWLDFLSTGRSPWLGHDPSPWVEMLDGLVESMGDIIPRTSQLDPDVPLSWHPAPDVLRFLFYSCECNRGSFRE